MTTPPTPEPTPAQAPAAAPIAQAAAAAPAPARVASSYGREDPARLQGIELREFAYRRGIARSQLAAMDDDKIRRELNFILHRQYEQRIEG